MPVSHLTNSVAEMFASTLNTLTGGSFSHLTTSEAEMLARIVSEMTGQEYSHLTTGVETLWELMLSQAATDGITFDRNTQNSAEILATIANNVSAGGGEEYEGPLDIVGGAVVAYGQRALSAAMLGQPYGTLHRYSDDAELEFDFDAEDGSVDSAAIEVWAGEELGAVTQWNDQSGNSKHAAQATLANMPDWVPDALGALPAMRYTAGKVLLASSVSVTQPAYTVFAVLSRTANAVVCGINETGDDYLEFIARNAEITLEQYEDATGDDVGGTFIPDPALGTSHHLIDVVLQQGGTHECRVDGVDAPASGNFDSGDAASLTGSFGLGGDVASGNLFAGDLIEIIVYNAALTSEQRLAIRQNMQAYYGTPALP